MRTLVLQMVEFRELALVNVDRFTKWTRHNLVHQWLLLAMTKSLTGTNATLSLHAIPLRHHSFLRGAGVKRFLTVASL